MKFVNRTEERNFMNKIIDEIMEERETCVWIEGTRGAGKSYFIKYIKENSKLPMFFWGNHNWIYKCNEASMGSEYQFFIEIISNFQVKYPNEVNDFLTEYFDSIYDISWLEILAYILPNIKFTKWAKDLINKPLKRIEDTKNDIANRLYNPGLRICLAKLVIYILTKIQNQKNIVFCIDDACWLDENSIRTFKILLDTVKYDKNIDLKISLIILTRPVNELNSGKDNYLILENILTDVYEELKYIRIKNFDYKATQEYIDVMDKNYVREITHNIYRITGGNPQELFQALKFNDYDLKEIVQVETNVTSRNYISSELIIKLAIENNYVLPIICSVSLIQQKMQTNWLTIITQHFCKQILDEEFNVIKYDECIKLLQQQSIIEINTGTIEITHDSLKETAIEYIKNNGEYVDYMHCLTSIIKNKFKLDAPILKEIIYLYSEFDPSKCFAMFTEYYKKNAYFLDASIIRFVAQSLVKEDSLFTINNMSEYIIPIILEKCVHLSYYELGYAIASILFYKQETLPLNIRYQYLVSFAKILIEKGMLKKEEHFNAINVIEQIFSLPQLDVNQKIESYIIAMSTYEHLLDFQSINKYNSLAKQLIDCQPVNEVYHAMFLRNQGLVRSHCVLEQQYVQAIKISEKIKDNYERKLMLGTCHNNLGLHYLYIADIKKALQHFEYSQKYLNEIGYDTFRVLNNIAVAYLLIGKDKMAYDYLLQAKSLNVDCIFEKLCIQSNISIVEHKQGKYKIAKDILSNIINDYSKPNKKTADDLVYSSAMVNMAYFYFTEGDYVNSAKFYKDSMFFKYRYNDDLQKKKRKEMLNLSMYHLGILDKAICDIDIEDNDSNIFRKMYAPIAFAYYII